jgi:hypothetical protein
MKFLKAFFVLKIFTLLPLALSAQNYYGGIPALFDDFSYTNTEFPIGGDSSNSLFGRNIWLTENGVVSSRAWHRYNWGDGIAFGEHSSIEPTPDGISLKISEGFRFSDIAPVLKSGFVFRHGTFLSRIRFGSLAAATNSIQAFWLFSPDHYRFKKGKDSIIYYHEVNYEWNNWFFGKGKKRLTANTIWGIHSSEGAYSTVKEMNFFKKQSGSIISLPTEHDNSSDYYIENKWFYCMIRLDSLRQVAEFWAVEDREASDKIIGGQAIVKEEITPVLHRGNFPRTALLTMYSLGIGSPDNDSINRKTCKMDVDWFYYTPNTNITASDAVKEVVRFKKQNIARINTIGKPTFHDSAAYFGPPSVFIEGPDETEQLRKETWIVRPSLKNTVYDVEYSYRRHAESGSTDWIGIFTPEATLYANATDTALEFRTTLKDWSGMTASSLKFVKVKHTLTVPPLFLFPNPTSGSVTIALPESPVKKEYHIEIYSVTGKKIQEFSTLQMRYLPIELGSQPAGKYILFITSRTETFKNTVTIAR